MSDEQEIVRGRDGVTLKYRIRHDGNEVEIVRGTVPSTIEVETVRGVVELLFYDKSTDASPVDSVDIGHSDVKQKRWNYVAARITARVPASSGVAEFNVRIAPRL